MSEIAAPTSAPAPSAAPAAPVETPNASAPDTGGEPSAAAAKPPEPAPKPARKHQIKVDGQVEEIDLDALDDTEIVKQIQMSRAASKRMQEAAEMRKRVAEIEKLAKTDPLKAIKLFNAEFDPDKVMEERLAQKYRESLLTPEQKAEAERVRKLEEKERELQAKEEEWKSRQRAEVEERVFRETEQTFMEALETGGLPKTPRTLYMMAEVQRLNLDKGLELTKDQLVAEVRHRINETNRHILGNLKGEALLKHLGDDVVKEVVRLQVEKIKKSKAPGFAPRPVASQDVEPEERPQRQMLSTKEFRKKLFAD